MPSFQSKARTIDHLGKSQIADMPTAILELWKNGYDAYADNMGCDLFAPGSLRGSDKYVMTVHDDGIGMNRKEVESVWLTIGTDSKTRGTETLSLEERLGKEKRVKMGEKGIGRLSVAYLGSPMMMVTKKIGEEPVLLLADWRIFTNYNLYLSEVEIPIKEGLPTSSNMDVLKKAFLENLDRGNWSEHESLKKDISDSVGNANILPELWDRIGERFSNPESHGTMFVIFEFDKDQIGMESHDQLMDSKGDDSGVISEWASNLRASLSGMINPFKSVHSEINTTFVVHARGGMSYDIIAKYKFFNEKDIDLCEHSIEGKFDEEGFFTGTVKVYGKKFGYTFRPNRLPGKTPYGPFELKLGHIEGRENTSSMTPELYRELNKKMESFGGLYIYKNDFRILPYGRQEYDFLKFEERRSKRAGTYFFSYRKMAGYIGLTDKNKGFREKAGREGFIDNRTYKEFKRDLIEFFFFFSARFYKSPEEGRKNVTDYEKTYRQVEVEKMKARERAAEKAEKKKERKTKKLLKEKIASGLPQLRNLTDKLVGIRQRISTLKEKSSVLLEEYEELEEEFTRTKQEFFEARLTGFAGLNLNHKEKYEFESYKQAEYSVRKELEEMGELIGSVRQRLRTEELRHVLEKEIREGGKRHEALLSSYGKRFGETRDKLGKNFNERISEARNERSRRLGELAITSRSEESLSNALDTLRRLDEYLLEEARDTFEPFLNHLDGLSVDVDIDLLTNYYKNQYEEMKKKGEAMHELAQLGMAVEIIDHQFNVLYDSVARNIANIRSSSSLDTKTSEYLDSLEHSIEHLENNHRLLTPLYRANKRVLRKMSGREIFGYLEKFFGEKLRIGNESILRAGDEFLAFETETYPSVFMPVFINVINNALYWLKSVEPEKREILIEKRGDEIIIQNSGKPIENHDLEKIFELFFSRRPSGRGIGLYLARMNLRSIGMDMYASNDHEAKSLDGGLFVIDLNPSEKGGEDLA